LLISTQYMTRGCDMSVKSPQLCRLSNKDLIKTCSWSRNVGEEVCRTLFIQCFKIPLISLRMYLVYSFSYCQVYLFFD
jgi:hypothetical protein